MSTSTDAEDPRSLVLDERAYLRSLETEDAIVQARNAGRDTALAGHPRDLDGCTEYGEDEAYVEGYHQGQCELAFASLCQAFDPPADQAGHPGLLVLRIEGAFFAFGPTSDTTGPVEIPGWFVVRPSPCGKTISVVEGFRDETGALARCAAESAILQLPPRTLLSMMAVGPMRSYYGPLLDTEPTMTFAPDGTATVTGGGRTYHLSADQVSAFGEDPPRVPGDLAGASGGDPQVAI